MILFVTSALLLLGVQSPQVDPPFLKDIEAFEAADKVHPPKQGGVVFVGSSSIRMWTTLDKDFPGMNLINRGFGGSKISDSVRYAKRIVTPYKPIKIVFFAGTNDINDGVSPEQVSSDYKEFVKIVHTELPNTRIAFIAVNPAPSRWAQYDKVMKTNTLISDFIKKDKRLEFIDIVPRMLDKDGKARPELFVSDQLHMNQDGYAIWVKAVRPFLAKK